MASSSMKGSGDDLPLEEIVFSCGICQATVSEVYASKDSNHGFHSGSGDDDGVVTKLWIADCSHITCGKHLEGGAAPFHPKGMQPRASCPQCMERGDDRLRELYGIRGLAEGDYDPAIPVAWTVCPPIKLDGTVPGMEPMRFQYMNLARYAGRVGRRWKNALSKQQAMEAAFSKERKQRRQAQSDMNEQKHRIAELEKLEEKLKRWESRKSIINHYLGAFTEMTREIQVLRGQLSELGYEVPQRSYTYDLDSVAQPRNAALERQDSRQHHGQSFPSSSTAGKRRHP
ncbi:hypothetical protein LTR08_003453 [Meristemomyces frigidus]|nr:hypothetical protein LTR08_003453 [Meristemomyces frigidus]